MRSHSLRPPELSLPAREPAWQSCSWRASHALPALVTFARGKSASRAKGRGIRCRKSTCSSSATLQSCVLDAHGAQSPLSLQPARGGSYQADRHRRRRCRCSTWRRPRSRRYPAAERHLRWTPGGPRLTSLRLSSTSRIPLPSLHPRTAPTPLSLFALSSSRESSAIIRVQSFTAPSLQHRQSTACKLATRRTARGS